MSIDTRVTALVENTARGLGLLGEHGLAFWIERDGHRVLFDTGQGMALAPNARILDVALEEAQAVVLSHGHYDHTGGLAYALDRARDAALYAHPAAFEAKYAQMTDGSARGIGMPERDKQAARARNVIFTTAPTEIVEGLFATGAVPRVTEYEDTGGPFYLDRECREPDPMDDDQAVYFAGSEGTVVVLGCAHAGIINTLLHVHNLTDGAPIQAVFGGTHLGGASPERMARTIAALGELGVGRLGPAHCTGLGPTVALWQAFPERCFPCGAGTVLEF